MEAFAEPFDLLLGRRTYDIFAGHWPHVTSTTAPNGVFLAIYRRAGDVKTGSFALEP